MLFGVHIQFQDMHFFNKIKETNIIQIQRVRNCDKSIWSAYSVSGYALFFNKIKRDKHYSDSKGKKL